MGDQFTFAELRRATITARHVRLSLSVSALSHGTARFPLEGDFM